MTVKFLDLDAAHAEIRAEIDGAIAQTCLVVYGLSNGWAVGLGVHPPCINVQSTRVMRVNEL